MIFKKIFDHLFHKGKLSMKHVFALFSFIFVVWAFYRHFPEVLPVWVEELILKPVFWLAPTLWVVFKVENKKFSSLGFTKKNLSKSLHWGMGLGLVFAVEGFLTNYFKYGGLKYAANAYTSWSFIAALVISFVTAISEETVFRGYIYTRLAKLYKSESLATLGSALLFTLIYLPVSIFVLSYQPLVMFTYLLFIFAYGLVAAFIFARTENLLASILLHIFWSWPIVLFR